MPNRAVLRPTRVVIGAVLTALCLAVATPAFAHVEVTADKPQAGATNVTVTFTSEAESSSAGIRSERVALPAGISPADVRLVKAPAGWKLTADANGYTVAGRALPIGTDAVHSIVIAQLPTDTAELVFKTVDTYGDGKVARWIEVRQPGQAEPHDVAPVLKLRPAARRTAAPPASASPTPAEQSTPSPAGTPSPGAPVAAPRSGEGTDRTGLWIGLAAVGGLALVAATLLAARRRRRTPPAGP